MHKHSKNKDFIAKQYKNSSELSNHSAFFFPLFPVVLVAGPSLSALAVLLWVALPAFSSFVVFAALGLAEVEGPSPSPAVFLPLGFFAGGSFELTAFLSFFDFLGGFESWE